MYTVQVQWLQRTFLNHLEVFWKLPMEKLHLLDLFAQILKWKDDTTPHDAICDIKHTQIQWQQKKAVSFMLWLLMDNYKMNLFQWEKAQKR